MNCPNCKHQLKMILYEGIVVETCESCQGEWLDAEELRRIVTLRRVKFDEEERRAIAQSTTITGVELADVDRDLPCPKCNGATDAINYGGDSGIIIDRCTKCRGIWMDGGELEKIQLLAEGWDDGLEEDLKKFGGMLKNVATDMDKNDDAKISNLPYIGAFINTCLNGIMDIADSASGMLSSFDSAEEHRTEHSSLDKNQDGFLTSDEVSGKLDQSSLPPAKYKTSCPHCGVALRLRDSHIGKRKQCPKCNGVFRVNQAPATVANSD